LILYRTAIFDSQAKRLRTRVLATALASAAVFAVGALAGGARADGGSGVREGDAGPYSWTVRSGVGARGGACLEVAITRRRGRFAYDRSRFRGCATGLTAKGPPLIVGGTQLSGAKAGMTVLALVFAPSVDRVRLVFSDGARKTISAMPLSAVGGNSGQRALRYAVFATPARRCLSKVVSEDDEGRSLRADGGGDACLPEIGAGVER
jgi:hypothetical protein